MNQTRNTENKLFTTLMATFLFLMLLSFTPKEAHTQNVQEQAQAVEVALEANNEIDPNIATVYVVGKRLPKNAS